MYKLLRIETSIAMLSDSTYTTWQFIVSWYSCKDTLMIAKVIEIFW